MSITILCPNLHCRSILQVPEDARGKKVRCSRCQKVFIVPDKKEKKRPQPTDKEEEIVEE
jgi:LSD1 subclass zinc finger protein